MPSLTGTVKTPAGSAPVIPLLLLGFGGYLLWFGVHYWRKDVTWPSDPIKSVLQGKGLPAGTAAAPVQANLTAEITRNASMVAGQPPSATAGSTTGAIGGGSGGGGGGGGTASYGKLANAKTIYQTLINEGFSTPQAIGIMGNMWAESEFNPELHVMDSNGYYSNGLVMFNESGYPQSRGWITGNPQQDIQTQVQAIRVYAQPDALAGSTGTDVAGNFAAYFEVCQGCNPGSTVANGWTARRGFAALMEQWLASGWATVPGGL